MNRKKIFFALIGYIALLSSITQAQAGESLKGYITGDMCGVQMSMICLPDHLDSKEEHIVFISEDGKSVYELQGVDQKQLREHFTCLVQIEGTIKDKTIEVKKITRVGKSAAGMKFGEGAMHRRPGRKGSSAHQGH
jgi:hypothetical protein